MTNRAPLIVAIVLLLVPVLYVGSYFALVVPRGIHGYKAIFEEHYRWQNKLCSRVFWPLEQIDRKLRPESWDLGGKF
ncbi:hypothetical protein ETAA8_14240 [Anatilimnocola aggregata]|uniref:Uncharacterized protein n=1 Tax=Anatilimnocola aggregata TaxID=2528021 RepID=A0A517Y7Z2_9BACT|nr:hypothetical protein [Anatilimnocola aggregata]QDU26346.1 hypothetical protein ETAA8_14240 [Anatilimnocola aggregata]